MCSCKRTCARVCARANIDLKRTAGGGGKYRKEQGVGVRMVGEEEEEEGEAERAKGRKDVS